MMMKRVSHFFSGDEEQTKTLHFFLSLLSKIESEGLEPKMPSFIVLLQQRETFVIYSSDHCTVQSTLYKCYTYKC